MSAHRSRTGVAASALAVIAISLGAAACASGGAGSHAPPGGGASGSPAASYSYYRSVMGGYGGMMGGGPSGGWMSRAGYQWMTGADGGVPGWMRGGDLPGGMMGGGDPGRVMGRLWAGVPGPRVSPADAARLGGQVPAGAVVDRAVNRITFTGSDIRFTVVASPPGGPDERFRIAGLADPAIAVPAGARVTITVVNAGPDTAHGLVITVGGAAAGSPMPMMTAPPAFPGAALWFLGDATSAGMPAGTLAFNVGAPGGYRYLCPVPRHAQEGMAGTFTVTG